MLLVTSNLFHIQKTILITHIYSECDINYLIDDIPNVIDQSLDGINRVIGNTVTISRGVWRYIADLEAELDPNMGELPCFSGPINDVFLNMIVNSAHAIETK
ncbi:MAG: hypothetical protein JKY66_07840 [Spongiibacteraceae bacterium]|nr:hypothetical protein [Spongiibacteraceae bacterium]